MESRKNIYFYCLFFSFAIFRKIEIFLCHYLSYLSLKWAFKFSCSSSDILKVIVPKGHCYKVHCSESYLFSQFIVPQIYFLKVPFPQMYDILIFIIFYNVDCVIANFDVAQFVLIWIY